ncbi:MAG: hypothetical protein GF419_14370 [Ignavibacteriales bacterium]|nr:hypothetical protein [Ignavibacteriales bacterium]
MNAGDQEKLPPTIGEYKGSPVISLPMTPDGKMKFTFGLTKAKTIIKYLEDIENFIEEHDKPKA